MPAIHTKIDATEYNSACSVPLLPFNRDQTIPIDATRLDTKPKEVDIIEESIIYLRVNVFFKNYPILSDSCKLLVYITVFAQKCLETFAKDQVAAKKEIYKLIDSCEWSADDKKHFFNNLIKKDGKEEELAEYLKEVREETAKRLLFILYELPESSLFAKFWASFGKRKFMGYEMPVKK